jgi:hypothetical protein
MATIIDQETDARFWSQTNYKPGQKLDPTDATDAKMIPVWKDIYAKVKRESDAGKLVTTFDHPVVAQNLVAAHAADQAAVAHLDAARTAPDPAAAQQHVAAAQAATEVAAQKTHEASTIQPPTVSPQLAHEAAQDAAQQPPPPEAPAKDLVAHAQAQAAHKPRPRGVLDKETDARFWAQTNYKPGQKLDLKDPTDATMIPVWLDIYAKVKREDDAGKLVLTYNHPVVAQNIADARVADQAAAMHLDAAAAAPDLHTARQNVAAAAVASQVVAQKTHEASAIQPPTVSPPLAHEAARRVGHEAARRPPHPHARDHLAQEQAKGAGRKAAGVHHHHARHRRPVKSAVHPRSIQDYRAQATQLAHEAGAPFVLVTQHPDGTPEHRSFGSRAELDAEYAKISEQHDQYKYVAAFDLAANANAPIHDSVGIPAAEHAEAPTPAEATATPPPDPSQTETPAAPAAPPEDKPAEDKPSSTGKIIAIAAAIAAAIGIAIVASRKSSPRTRTPKVIVATPTSTRALRI